MTPHDKHPLDQAVDAIRQEPLDAAEVESSARRVWERLEAEAMPRAGSEPDRIRGCADFQALIPAFVAGELTPARAKLVEDHTRSCVPCRRVLLHARAARTASPAISAAPSKAPMTHRASRWAAAAAAAFCLVTGTWFIWQQATAPVVNGEVQLVEGNLYRMDGATPVALRPGDRIDRGEAIRTARDAGAIVRLADGSRVELRERSEIALDRRGDGAVVDLARGSVLIEASEQGSGHLYVATGDCLVSVTGTIFSVSHGTLGSRVSVVEGEVRVGHDRNETVLAPGDQTVTNPGLERIPIDQDIAWSRDYARYAPLLAELRALRRDLDRIAPEPALRHEPRLLGRVPADTVVYAAFPNVGSRVGEAHRLLKERMESSPVLKKWWEESLGNPAIATHVEKLVDGLRSLGERVGDEVVVTVQKGTNDAPGSFLAMAEVADAESFRQWLEGELEAIAATHDVAGQDRRRPWRFLNDVGELRAIPASGPGFHPLLLWSKDGMVLAGTSPSTLLGAIGSGAGSMDAAFRSRIADSYREGAGWLFVADLSRILPADEGRERDQLERLGILDAQHVIVEKKEVGGHDLSRAVITFDQPRRGLASWLAAPGPMGGLSFVSPDPRLATAFVVDDTTRLVDDLMTMGSSDPAEMASTLAQIRAQTGIDPKEDLARPLGGEVVFAVDGPVLPKPSWKLILEVYDPATFQHTLGTLISHINDSRRETGEPELRLGEEVRRGRTYWSLRGGLSEFHWTYADGYLVAAPMAVLVDRAVEGHDSGLNLTSSPKFLQRLPGGGDVHVSALVYHDLGPLFDALRSAGGGAYADSLGVPGEWEPRLVYAVAQPDRIVLAGDGDDLEDDLMRLLGLRAAMEGVASVQGKEIKP